MSSGIAQEKYCYSIRDGTKLGEILQVWPHDLALEQLGLISVANTIGKIKKDAWDNRFGIDKLPTSENVREHIDRPGSYQLASFTELDPDASEQCLGFIQHRPIYGLLGKLACKAGVAFAVNRSTPQRAYVHNIDVRPEWQDLGIGSALMHAGLRCYPPESEVALDALGEWSYTHEWFEKMGLEENKAIQLDPIEAGEKVLQQVRFDGASVAEVISNLDVHPIESHPIE